jgi:hypothetical protein
METETIQKNGASPKSQMSRKLILLLVMICFSSISWGQTTSEDLVLLDKSPYDFGEIVGGKEASTIFRFRNNTNKEVIVKNEQAGTLRATALESIVKPGAIGRIKVTYSPLSLGPFRKSISVPTNIGVRLKLDVTGVRYPEKEILNYKEGLARVVDRGNYGFVDENGKEVIPIKYDYASDFDEGTAIVKFNGKYGIIDKTGREVISCIFVELAKAGMKNLYWVQKDIGGLT